MALTVVSRTYKIAKMFQLIVTISAVARRQTEGNSQSIIDHNGRILRRFLLIMRRVYLICASWSIYRTCLFKRNACLSEHNINRVDFGDTTLDRDCARDHFKAAHESSNTAQVGIYIHAAVERRPRTAASALMNQTCQSSCY